MDHSRFWMGRGARRLLPVMPQAPYRAVCTNLAARGKAVLFTVIAVMEVAHG